MVPPNMDDVMRPPTVAELFPGIENQMPGAASAAAILAEARNLPGDVTFAFGAYVGDSPRDVIHEATHSRLSDPRVTMYVDRVVVGSEICASLVRALRAGELSLGVLPASMNSTLRLWLVRLRFENLWCAGRRGAIGTMPSIYGGEPCRTCGEKLNHTLTCPEW